MTPVALWTGRLPGLRRVPRRATLVLATLASLLGFAGAVGALGANGPYGSAAASLFVGWILLRHRWPTTLPVRLRALERPQGADERAVLVEFREEGALLGWDVGILWFERGGVGFVGRTVSFVLPRAAMVAAPDHNGWRAVLRAPRLTAKVFTTDLGIVPLAPVCNAHMTLARIDALSDAVTSETILPPTSLHPDLISRGLAVRERLPVLYGLFVAVGLTTLATQSWSAPPGAPTRVAAVVGLLVCLAVLGFGTAPPASIRARFPKNPRRRR